MPAITLMPDIPSKRFSRDNSVVPINGPFSMRKATPRGWLQQRANAREAVECRSSNGLPLAAARRFFYSGKRICRVPLPHLEEGKRALVKE